ncbi:MAG: hypothetical protein LBV31_03260, partial [Prevotellaceae bacterium]|jgi:hypothetical protein|nr:hypothetical protein [Prevotellaceae bacterium]
VPVVVEPQKKVLDARYSDFNSPLAVGNNVHPLSAATLQYSQPAEPYEGFLRFALGSYPNSLVDFAYPLVNQPDLRIDAEVHHRAAYNAYFNTVNTAKISFDKNFKTFTFFGGLNGGFQGVRYYGLNVNGNNKVLNLKRLAADSENMPLTETDFTAVGRPAQTFTVGTLLNAPNYAYLWRFGLNLGFRSAENAENWRYAAQLKYNTFHNTAGITEHSFHTNAGLSCLFAETDRLGADVDLYNGSYSATDSIAFNYYRNYAVLNLKPYLELNRIENLTLRLGLALTLPLSGEKGVKIAPDVRADFKALPDLLNIYAGITGKYKVNTMNDLFYENPYLAPDVRAKNAHTPFDIVAGIVLKPAAGLLFDVFVDYSYTSNQYYFVNKGFTGDTTIYTNRFDVVYDKSWVFAGGARVSYTFNNKFNAELKGIFTKGKGEKEALPWNFPFYDVSFNTSWRVVPDLTLSLTGFYQAGIYAKIGNVSANDLSADGVGVKMKNRFDLNLGAAYTYRNWLTFTAKANNLLNQQYDIFYGYEVQGFNFMGGVVLSF